MSDVPAGTFDLSGKVRISPPIWPDHWLKIQPGDLSKFARHNYSFTDAPLTEGCGGVIYFDSGVSRVDFEALMRMMGVQPAYVVRPSKDFAVFTAESNQPGKDRYLAQMRVISKFGLRSTFGALTNAEYERFPEQELTIVDALWLFIEQERKRWGMSWMVDQGLGGKFGGDGYFAREELAFGFMVEDHYYNIYRIWSRAWLVTK